MIVSLKYKGRAQESYKPIIFILRRRRWVNNERLKFAAAYWIPSAGAEATGGELFSAEGMYKCDLILITLPEGW